MPAADGDEPPDAGHHPLRDALTGLPNRTLFDDRLRQALLAASRETQSLAVLVAEIAGLDEVDGLVAGYGEALTQAIAARIETLLREEDTVARLGANDFAILPAGRGGEDGAASVAWKILQAVQPPFIIEGQAIRARLHIGIALYPEHGADPEILLRRAKSAGVEARRTGSGFAFFAANPDNHGLGHRALMADLKNCVGREELVLHYQPRIELLSGRTMALEALVRWDHPRDGLLEPDRFVPLAERSGVIPQLTRWVLDEALRQLRGWRDRQLDLSVAINLSARSLEGDDIVDVVAELTETWDIPPERLTLEVTEGMLINAAAPSVLDRLHRMGERLSIDDYGTGYSALSYLQQLPVDEVKIDKSFVIDLAAVSDTATIVRSTIDLGHDLGLEVCAEGVEDPAALQMLVKFGCDSAQGYFISRPLSADGVADWLAAGDHPPTAI